MSLDKGIEAGKEKRKAYYDSRRFDPTCRNHGSCSWCEGNRQHRHRKIMKIAEDVYSEWEDGEDEGYTPFWELADD